MAACKSTAHCAASFFTISFSDSPEGCPSIARSTRVGTPAQPEPGLNSSDEGEPVASEPPELWNDLDEGDRPEEEETEGELSG